MVKIAVLVSGGGTNLQALIDAKKNGRMKNGEIALVVGSKPGIYALTRAEENGIETAVVRKKDYDSAEGFDEALIGCLKSHGIGLVVLAGYLTVLSERVVREFPNRIINIHPALIPAFCGDGYYGLKVHEAALQYGVKVTGATVHFVNEVTDGGAIIAQKSVLVREDDTPESLQKRVMEEAEWTLLPRAVELFCDGKLKVDGHRVSIGE